jgi:hypothetical protein
VRSFSFALFLVAGCSGQIDTSITTDGVLSTTPEPCSKPDELQECTQSNGDFGTRSCARTELGYVWSVCEPVKCQGTFVACTTQGGQPGAAACSAGISSSACANIGDCTPGQTNEGGDPCCQSACELTGGTWTRTVYDCQNSCNTPLVLAFHDEPVTFTDAGGEFDLAGRNASMSTRWVSSRTPWLAFDLDGNGTIDDGRELFGSMTDLPGGRRAANGFAALATLDTNADGVIDARDPSFSKLVSWTDLDQDRRSSVDELTRLADAGVVAIHLTYAIVPRCIDGDCEVERATFVFRDHGGTLEEGAVVDVHLATR